MAVTTPRPRRESSTAPANGATAPAAIDLRDFGLMLGALTLARLASVYDAPLRLR